MKLMQLKARLAKHSKKYESIDQTSTKVLNKNKKTRNLKNKSRGEFETILQQQKQDFDAKLQ